MRSTSLYPKSFLLSSSLFVLALTLLSCNQDADLFMTATREKSDLGKKFIIDIDASGNRAVEFVELTMCVSNKKNYSADSMQFVDFKSLGIFDFDALKSIELLPQNHMAWNFVVNNHQLLDFSFSEKLRNKNAKITMDIKQPCRSGFMELARIEGQKPNEQNSLKEYSKILCFRSILNDDEKSYNSKMFFENSDHLFEIYKGSKNCNFGNEWIFDGQDIKYLKASPQ